MKTWVHDCHSTVSQPAIHKSSKTEKSSKNDVSRTNSKVTMCWSIASFRHTSGPRGGVHHLKSGTLNTALEHYFLRGSWWFHFVYTYKVPPLGLQRGATFLSQMRNKLKKQTSKPKNRAQSKQEHVLVVLHNCTNDYMWLSYTVLWGEKWCQLTHTTTKQWRVIPYTVMMLWTKRERKNAHTRLVTNDESSQLNTSHDEGNKVLEKG